MNKKSLILSLLLCLGLLTPQETKPFFGTALIIASAVYGTVLLNTLGVPLNPFRTKNHITDYTKEQDFIKKYTAHVQIYKKAKKSNLEEFLVNETITTTTAEDLITQVVEHSEGLRGKKGTFIHIDSTITLHTNKECHLTTIDRLVPSKKSLIKQLRNMFLVSEGTLTTSSIIKRALFLSTAVFIIPSLLTFYIAELVGGETIAAFINILTFYNIILLSKPY